MSGRAVTSTTALAGRCTSSAPTSTPIAAVALASTGSNYDTEEVSQRRGPRAESSASDSAGLGELDEHRRHGWRLLRTLRAIHGGRGIREASRDLAHVLARPAVPGRDSPASARPTFFAGRNLKTWTNYRGVDPEVNNAGSEYLTQGLDWFANPQTRSFVISFSLNR